MNIIIPMAGWGSRLRPHTLTVPKPMIKIAGKSIVEHLVENLLMVCPEKVNNIAFIIRKDFGAAVKNELKSIAEKNSTPFSIHYQEEPLGTAHAINSAKEHLFGNTIVAFADTIFYADFKIDTTKDGVIWVQKIDDPSAFGVVKLNEQNEITDFVEKPKDYVSDLAIIGVYFFRNGDDLKAEITHLLDNDLKEKGEYQLTNALENMKQKGAKFVPGQVNEWLDCGNKDATVYSNQRILEILSNNNKPLISKTCKLVNAKIIPPCFIDDEVVLTNCEIGPHVSIGKNTSIENAVIENSMIQTDSTIKNKRIKNSMIGSKVTILGHEQDIQKCVSEDLSIGDFNVIK